MSRVILALSAYKFSGKDTVADYLCAQYGFKRISFAAKLKDMVASQYNVPREFLDSPTHKEMPLLNLPVIPSDASTQRLQSMLATELASGYWTPRALCILEGSVKRAVYSNYWVRECIQEMTTNSTDNYVITDMRYKTEADVIKLMFPQSKIVRIDRFDSSPTTDPSERDMDDYKFDYAIENRGSIDMLHWKLHILYNELFSKLPTTGY